LVGIDVNNLAKQAADKEIIKRMEIDTSQKLVFDMINFRYLGNNTPSSLYQGTKIL
jgi:hypothetical protein